MKNKRSSSSSSLDCQSLQSSLKRVRLSCSPGELRLQRDLRFLPSMGWQPEEDQDSKDSSVPFLVDSNPKWYFQSHDVVAELQLLDPLRLMLSIQHPQRCSRLWIQIPRMYPHRPPVIPRVENMAMDQIIIVDEPPGMPQGQDTASETPGPTVIYQGWSPVRQLGDLLGFLLKTSAQQPIHARSSSAASTSGFDTRSNSNQISTEVSLAMTSESFSSSPTDVSSSVTDGRIGRPTTGTSLYFMDEHKMDDAMGYRRYSSEQSGHNMASQVLLPNRFDVGYGKYCNPLEARPRTSQQEESNAMDEC